MHERAHGHTPPPHPAAVDPGSGGSCDSCAGTAVGSQQAAVVRKAVVTSCRGVMRSCYLKVKQL